MAETCGGYGINRNAAPSTYPNGGGRESVEGGRWFAAGFQRKGAKRREVSQRGCYGPARTWQTGDATGRPRFCAARNRQVADPLIAFLPPPTGFARPDCKQSRPPMGGAFIENVSDRLNDTQVRMVRGPFACGRDARAPGRQPPPFSQRPPSTLNPQPFSRAYRPAVVYVQGASLRRSSSPPGERALSTNLPLPDCSGLSNA